MTKTAPPPTGVHPAAELFPMLSDSEMGLLVDDLSANGLLEPMVVCEGLLLDGRNRRRGCELAGVEPRYVEWEGEGGSPVAFIAARNLHRRHLNESQRSVIAARMKGMFEEEARERERAHQFGSQAKTHTTEVSDNKKRRESSACADLHRPGPSNDRAAGLVNVSPRLVALASRVLRDGDEQLVAAIDAGQITVCDAASIVTLPRAEQRAAVDAVRSGKARTVRSAAKAAREARAGGVPDLPRIDESERHSPQRLRRVARRFEVQCETLLRYINLAAMACGGPNDYTRRMRDSLDVARRAMRECTSDFGRRPQPMQ